MNAELLAKMEGLLFVVGDEGISLAELKSLIESEEEDILACLEQLKQDMKQSNRGIRLARLGNRYRLTTKVEHADLYKKLAASPIQGGLSRQPLKHWRLSLISNQLQESRLMIFEVLNPIKRFNPSYQNYLLKNKVVYPVRVEPFFLGRLVISLIILI